MLGARVEVKSPESPGDQSGSWGANCHSPKTWALSEEGGGSWSGVQAQECSGERQKARRLGVGEGR